MPGPLSLFLLAAAAGEPTSAKGNLQSLFTGEDYPAIALANDEEGRVRVRLVIDPSGLVESCKVITSSGSKSLDEQTCAVIRARAQFVPATDGKGRPVRDTYVQAITWRIAPDLVPPAPRNAWTTRTALNLTDEGKIVDCHAQSTGYEIGDAGCKAFVSAMERMEMAAPGALYSLTAITDVHFYPMEPADAPEAPKIDDAKMEVRQVSRVSINGNGRVTQCQGIHYTGHIPEQADACVMLRTTRFERSPAAPELVATVVMTAYTRKRTIS